MDFFPMELKRGAAALSGRVQRGKTLRYIDSDKSGV
jgi:hypothetical protein